MAGAARASEFADIIEATLNTMGIVATLRRFEVVSDKDADVIRLELVILNGAAGVVWDEPQTTDGIA